MTRTAQSLEEAGVASRFVSLGLVGHTYATDREGILDAALAWVEGRSNDWAE